MFVRGRDGEEMDKENVRGRMKRIREQIDRDVNINIVTFLALFMWVMFSGIVIKYYFVFININVIRIILWVLISLTLIYLLRLGIKLFIKSKGVDVKEDIIEEEIGEKK